MSALHTHEPRLCRTPALCELDGWRVEVVDQFGKTYRFIVGTTDHTHIELKTRASGSGINTMYRTYQSITPIEQVYSR